MTEVQIGEQKVTVERFTLAKAMRVITLLSLIQKSVPEINTAMAQFKRDYATENVVELDRVQAKMRYGPQPVVDEDGDPIMRKDPDGKPTGDVLTIPSPIDRMTEQDWERAGHVLRLRDKPSTTELLTAIFPLIYEQAEQPVLRLLALVAMPNRDVMRYVRSDELWNRVDELADELISPAELGEVMELAVTAAEQVEGQVMDKAKGLGDRVGNLGRLFGIQRKTSETSPTSSEQPEPPSIESASPSPDSSSGTPTESSASPGTPSTPSVPSSPVSVS